MNPRQARRERREAERKAKKLELKKSRLPGAVPVAEANGYPEIQPRWNPELEDEFSREEQIRLNAAFDRMSLRSGRPIPTPGPSASAKESVAAREAAPPRKVTQREEPGFVSQAPSRADINRANAQFSTGPTSAEGKVASSRNSTKHGLASGQVIVPGEDSAAFEDLLCALVEEHEPASVTEELLVKEMAQSYWLTQRALRLQTTCFTQEEVNQKQLALFLRYQTTHQRAFHKAFTTLLQLKKLGFVSQRIAKPAVNAGFVSQPDSEMHPLHGFVPQNPLESARESTSEPQKDRQAA